MFSFEAFLRFENWMRALYRVIGLNLLWTLTTVLGLGVFGFGPASYALARYLDRWVRHGETPALLPAYLAAVRERPLRSMSVGWILLGAGAVVVTNIFFGADWYVQFLNVVALGVLGVAAAYVFPLMSATGLGTLRQLFAVALLVGFGSLHWTVLGATVSLAALWAMWQVAPLLAGAFGVGVPAVAVALVTRVVFREFTPADSTGVGALLPKTRRRNRAAIHAPTTQPTTEGLAR